MSGAQSLLQSSLQGCGGECEGQGSPCASQGSLCSQGGMQLFALRCEISAFSGDVV